MDLRHVFRVTLATTSLLLVVLSCGGGGGTPSPTATVSAPLTTSTATTSSPSTDPICNCVPAVPDTSEYRRAAKHVGLPGPTGEETTVAAMLSWPAGADPAFDAPRTGRELQMYHISRAYLYFVWLVGGDCDMHMELADVPDVNAPRIVVETTIDTPFCPARSALNAQLVANNVPVGGTGFNLQTPLVVDVLGLAFQDANHPRGTTHIGGVWEIHPAIVRVVQ